MSAASPETLSNADLARRIQVLQSRAFELYEDAALQAEADPRRADSIYATAEQRAAPLIEQARVLNDERVRRLRARAKRWRVGTLVIAAIGVVGLVWLMAARG